VHVVPPDNPGQPLRGNPLVNLIQLRIVPVLVISAWGGALQMRCKPLAPEVQMWHRLTAILNGWLPSGATFRSQYDMQFWRLSGPILIAISGLRSTPDFESE
jgi:hypothetical protein